MSERRFAILARSDGYQGFERAGAGSDVPPEVLELAAAGDVAGVRKLLVENGLTGYDLVALGDVGGTAWVYLGFDVADASGNSAIVHGEPEGLNQYGLFWNPRHAEAFRDATGAAEIVLVQRMRRTALLPGDALWYTIGNEYNPGNPFGRITLNIDARNEADLALFSREGNFAWKAGVDPALVAQIRSDLERGGFPDVPQHNLPAGATVRELELVTGVEVRSAWVYARYGLELDGYKEAFAALDALAVRISGGKYRGVEDTLDPSAVSNVREEPSGA